MAADIKDPQVGFPFGEDLSIVRVIKCEVEPDVKDGKVQETGKIHITLEYDDATMEHSKGKSKDRLFCICNTDNKKQAFTKFGDITARFTADARKVVTGDPKKVVHKELHLVITGEGEKKNSMQ